MPSWPTCAPGAFNVAWGDDDLLAEAAAWHASHASLGLGLVDAVVIVTSVRVKATAIAAPGSEAFRGRSRFRDRRKLLPRDLS